jgi:hypothetical protein
VLQLLSNTGGFSGDFASVVSTGLAAGQYATFNASHRLQQHHRRSRAFNVCHGPRSAGLWRLADVASAAAAGDYSGCLNERSSKTIHNRAWHRKVPGPLFFGALLHAAQFTPGSRTTLLTRPPLAPSDLEYTPARSADKHLPDAHCRRLSILSPAVTATGTTFWAA